MSKHELTHGERCALRVLRLATYGSPKFDISAYGNGEDADGVSYHSHIDALIKKKYLRQVGTAKAVFVKKKDKKR